MSVRIIQGDCRDVMRRLADDGERFDSIVCDPPYHLTSGNGSKGFMGKEWDGGNVAFDPVTWALALDLLKPGGYLLAFGGARTYHRMACAIEDAGFEVRDQIMWLYGSGFPKSLDVSKAVAPDWFDETELERGEVSHTQAILEGRGTALKPGHEPIVMARKPLVGTVAANVLEFGSGALAIDKCRVPTTDSLGGGGEKAQNAGKIHEGWQRPWMADNDKAEAHAARVRANVERSEALGRWPANVLHDGSDEVEAAFAAFGTKTSGKLSPEHKVKKSTGWSGGSSADRVKRDFGGDTGSVSRFYYCAKASTADRDDGLEGLPEVGRAGSSGNNRTRVCLTCGLTDNGSTDHSACGGAIENRVAKPARNPHPTVKPTPLMRYLCRLVTPPGGTILDPFCGSGSTGRGAVLEGFNFVGVELDAGHCDIAERRIVAASASVPPPDLFSLMAAE